MNFNILLVIIKLIILEIELLTVAILLKALRTINNFNNKNEN